jgi:hypothetical protein
VEVEAREAGIIAMEIIRPAGPLRAAELSFFVPEV